MNFEEWWVEYRQRKHPAVLGWGVHDAAKAAWNSPQVEIDDLKQKCRDRANEARGESMNHLSDDGFEHWFAADPKAWRDYYDQAYKQPRVKDAFGLARAGYAKVSHPRELHEPWYVDPDADPEAAEKPRAGFREQRELSDAARGPPLIGDDVRARAAQYLKGVGKR